MFSRFFQNLRWEGAFPSSPLQGGLLRLRLKVAPGSSTQRMVNHTFRFGQQTVRHGAWKTSQDKAWWKPRNGQWRCMFSEMRVGHSQLSWNCYCQLFQNYMTSTVTCLWLGWYIIYCITCAHLGAPCCLATGSWFWLSSCTFFWQKAHNDISVFWVSCHRYCGCFHSPCDVLYSYVQKGVLYAYSCLVSIL